MTFTGPRPAMAGSLSWLATRLRTMRRASEMKLDGVGEESAAD